MAGLSRSTPPGTFRCHVRAQLCSHYPRCCAAVLQLLRTCCKRQAHKRATWQCSFQCAGSASEWPCGRCVRAASNPESQATIDFNGLLGVILIQSHAELSFHSLVLRNYASQRIGRDLSRLRRRNITLEVQGIGAWPSIIAEVGSVVRQHVPLQYLANDWQWRPGATLAAPKQMGCIGYAHDTQQ